MPYLPDAVGSVLAQRGVALELIAVDDGSTDGSLQWLHACAAALAERRAQGAAEDTTTAYDTVVEDALGGKLAWQPGACVAATPAEVAARTSPGNALRVLAVRSSGPSGQGLALNTALAAARGALIGEHEADDLRPPHAFVALRDALAANPAWDAATSRIVLGGWPRPGMQRWADWQNSVGVCGGPQQLTAARFVEIPALRAAGLYRREALARIAARPYRDLWQLPCGTLVDTAVEEGTPMPAEPLPSGWWPVDSDFFGRFFAAGLVLGKLPDALYVWRQYPAQSTRTHTRCSLDRLRACKVAFLTAARGPAERAAVPGGDARIQLWGAGASLDAWAADLRAAGVRCDVVGWRPGEPAPAGAWPCPDSHLVVARLWAFGMEKARARVRACAPGGFDEGGRDWFVGS